MNTWSDIAASLDALETGSFLGHQSLLSIAFLEGRNQNNLNILFSRLANFPYPTQVKQPPVSCLDRCSTTAQILQD